MEFRILGALEVTRDGRPVAVGGGRQRALLALLTIERNRPVSADRIVEELWDGRAPATAPKVVQNLVSQLRRALGSEDVLHTRGHGYELAIPDESVDAVRFERMLEEGRGALADGDPEQAGERLREALGLWRGPALGDLAGESWASAEAARLEERRLVALERRIDADLALGRHADLVGELESLVAREPLREGLRAQLMLALYRSGRQAEALDAYQRARRTLAEELGLEPSPALARLHEDILRQEATLEPPAQAPPRRRPAAARSAPAGALLLGGGLLLLAAVAAAVALLSGGGERPRGAAAAGLGQLVALDAATGKELRRLPAGRAPAAVVARDGDLWSIDGEARTVVHADARTGTVETLATGASPLDVAIGAGSVWVENGAPRERSFALGPVPSELVELDPATRRQRGAVPLPVAGADATTGFVGRLAVSPEAVWAITGDGSVARIDPATRSIAGVTRRIRANAIAAGGAGVWALTEAGEALRLDPRSGRIRRRLRLPSDQLGTLTVAGDAVWITSALGDKLWRVPSGAGRVTGSLDVAGVGDIAATADAVWLANPLAGTVTHVDPSRMRIVRTVRVGGVPRALAIDGGTVWVAVSGTAPAITTKVAGVTPLPGSVCEPVIAAGGGKADVLVVSDLPLQGDARLTAGEMAQAIKFVLREHGFRAGRLRIAYQSCDDALPGTATSDSAKCTANARAYAANADVVAVIGTFNSGCAEVMLPELNRAKGGPLGMISPLNSYVGLTRMPPGINVQGILGQLYPTGRRSFVRVFPADDLEGPALAQLARDRGARRVFALDDGYRGYSDLIAAAFERAARRLGLDVVGRARWKATAGSYAGLAQRVADSRPDAVLVSGLLNSNAPKLVRELRARLGPAVDLLAADGLAAPELLRAVGPAARGTFVAYTGAVNDRLPAAGRRFLTRFAPTQPGGTVETFAVYAAQATEVLLDALARSDGTRGSVIDELFRTRMRGSLTGDIAFDERGDIAEGTVTILRVVGRGRSPNIASVDGTVVERVMRLSPKLAEGGPDG